MPAPCPPRRLTFLSSTALLLLTLAGLLWSVLPTPPRAGVGLKARPASAHDSDALTNSDANEPSEARAARLGEAFGRLPLSFEANEGQTDAKVKFLSRGQGYTLFLTPTEAVIRLRIADCGLRNRQSAASNTIPSNDQPCPDSSKHDTNNPQSAIRNPQSERPQSAVLRMSLVGANKQAEVAGLEEQSGKSNYLLGRDPSKWHANVPHFSRVNYKEVYEGVDLEYYGNQRQLEYDFRVAPGADANQIRLAFRGAKHIRVDEESGDLLLETAGGELRQHKPIVYQEVSGKRRLVEARYRLEQTSKSKRGARGAGRRAPDSYQVGFELAAYDTSLPLVIDPVLSYSTYVGGNPGFDSSFAIAVDSFGNAYITGRTSANDYPTTAGALDATLNGGSDVFVTKLNAAGTALVYSTYLGGTSTEVGSGIAVDDVGNAYVVGQTDSVNFPVVNQFKTATALPDCFLSKLNPTGSALVYSTYIGGAASEGDQPGVAVDSAGVAYVVGQTFSSDFLTGPAPASTFDNTLNGTSDAFLVKVNTRASGAASFIYGTFIGGSVLDAASGIAVDAASNMFVAGRTGSSDFPLSNPLDNSLDGLGDAFVLKFNAAGSALIFSTYLGGSGFEFGSRVAVDLAGNPYVVTTTDSSDFPTSGGIQPTFGGAADVTATKYNAVGTAIFYSTYLGGSGVDSSSGIAVDQHGQAVITGTTGSTDFPVANAAQSTFAGLGDFFITKLSNDAGSITYSTYLGGSGDDQAYGVALDPAGNAYVAGQTDSSNIPTTTGAFQTALNGGQDAVVAKLTQFGSCGTQPSFTASTGSPFAAGTGVSSTAIGDFNGDGNADLVTTSQSTNEVSVLLGNGAGSFGTPTNFGVGTTPASVTVGDFNEDGNQDIVTANQNSNDASVLLGNGAGGFGAATSFAAGNAADTVAVSDFNSDGNQDLAVVNGTDGSVSILSGNGAGAFGAPTNFAVGTTPRGMAIGDFNLDGNQDLAVSNQSTDNVSVLLGNGAGAFGAATNFVVGDNPNSVAVGDFDADGDPDLAVANINSNNVSVLLGNGAGGFAAATNFNVGTGPFSVAVSDLNGDSKPDIATANINSSNVSVLLGNGAGSFGAATNFNTGGALPIPVAVGDFNGDTRPDLAVGNFSSNSVSVLLSGCGLPTTASTVTVNTTTDADDGACTALGTGNGCTLREAINASNALAGTDTIIFDIPGAGVHTISPTSALPTITDPVTIDGYTQTGASANTLAVGNDAVLLIELNGTGAGASGLTISAGSSTVRGLVINRFTGNGIVLQTNSSNTITGNFIGTNPAGTADQGNGSRGILIASGNANTIGAAAASARNLISGNGNDGVEINSNANVVRGNYIGTDAAGSANGLGGSGRGLAIVSGTGNAIGGSATGTGNVISGNANDGVIIFSNGNSVAGNHIGTNAAGTATVLTGGFAQGEGLILLGNNNTVGGSSVAARNVISGSALNGVVISGTGNVISGNYVGVGDDGATAIPNASSGFEISGGTGNLIGGTTEGAGNIIASNGADGITILSGTGVSILGNSIRSNGTTAQHLGIDLVGTDGVTANDANDADSGSNNLQNFPVLTAATFFGTNTNVQGTFNSAASTTYRLQFFSNQNCDPSGNGEGQTFLGSATLTTDAAGNASFDVTLSGTQATGEGVTATATDPAGNTSEFSNCRVLALTDGCGSASFNAATNFAVGTTPVSVAVGDFNGDGKQDLAASNSSSNSVSILLGDGAGNFGAATNFGAGPNPQGVAVGDFNGDGNQDLATANFTTDDVSVLLGDGAGSFGAATNFGAGDGSISVAVGDFNGDGKQDLATANQNSSTASVLLGDGAGNFGAATNLVVGTNPFVVVVSDFNGDGNQDLATANFNSSNVSVLLGDGAGGFGAASNFSAAISPQSVTVGDFNGDGNQDLATANFDSNDVSVLLGDGAGGFGAATNFGAGTNPFSVAAGDFDGDGDQDLVTANISSDDVSVLPGNGTGGFAAATNFGVGTSPFSVAVGDFNGDGKPDLAAANSSSDNVSVLLNNCTAPLPSYVVNVTTDGADVTPGDDSCDDGTGNCSLRAAIQEANAHAGADNITFNIPGAGVHTISPTSVLPSITQPVTIDGYTQPGSSANTLASGTNAVLLIELAGNAAGAGVSGLQVAAGGDATTIRGLVINRFTQAGLRFNASSGNTVEGCFLGTNPAGAVDLGNTLNGVSIVSGSNNNVGGSTPAARNLISGNNTSGIDINGGNLSGNVIKGNLIGTNAAGTAAIANGTGIVIGGTPNVTNNTIGGTTTTPGQGAGNVISGNTSNGILLNGAAVTGTTVQGNIIGLSAGGTADLGNAADGINVTSSANNTIGGVTTSARNVISGNNSDGIQLTSASGNTISDNFIGTDITGAVDLGNTATGINANACVNLAVGVADAGNVISGNNADGVLIQGVSTGASVRGNFIGTNAAGTADLGNNGDGIQTSSAGVAIGGTASGQRNVISGNNANGINISASTTTVFGNFIGTDTATAIAIGNTSSGVNISGAVTGNVIGGTGAGQANVIAFNTLDGVNVAGGTGTRINGNSIRSNGTVATSLGIDLVGANGINANDANDADTGSNNLQNFPLLTSAASGGGNTTVTGTLNSTAATNFRVEVYSGTSCDTAGNGEGETFVGFQNVTTDGTGNTNINAVVSQVPLSRFITATATNQTTGDTSEFSQCIQETGANATFVVNSNADTSDSDLTDPLCNDGTGNCTLRAAIEQANSNPSADTINFNIGGGGAQAVTPASTFPTIIHPVTIDGTTQTGFAGSPLIELNGASAGAGASGLTITAGTSVVRALVINRFTANGILLQTSGGNTVTGCRIGTDAAGTTDLGNTLDGIRIDTGSTGNTIGGLTATPGTGLGNLISGNNSDGVEINGATSGGNTLLGNLVGTNAAGTASLGNARGVFVTNAPSNTFGGSTSQARNVVSGNGAEGIEISGETADSNVVTGNYIGTDITGAADVGNGNDGVQITLGCDNTVVGGLTATPGTAPGNLISGNNEEGISIDALTTTAHQVLGNIIGLNVAGTAALRNESDGILIINSPSNIIGGSDPQARNIISGNNQGITDDGIELSGNDADLNLIAGNYIGTDITGTVDLGNGGDGVATGAGDTNTIGGSTATPGTAPGNLISGNGSEGIQIDGSANLVRGNIIGLNATGTAALGNTGGGYFLNAGANNVLGGATADLRNIISGNGSHGVQLDEGVVGVSDNNTVQSNYIGTDITGLVDLGNAGDGINVSGGDILVIGGATATPGTVPGNVISGNTGDGIQLTTASVGSIFGNLVGLKANGTEALPNSGHGVHIPCGDTNTVGGTAANERNVISANGGNGVIITCGNTGNASSNDIIGNYIGTDITGTVDLGNTLAGVRIEGFAPGNAVGGSAAGAGNLISGNNAQGVLLGTPNGINAVGNLTTIQGNFIGTQADGTSALGNAGNGVEVNQFNATNANNSIGGAAAGAGNRIAFNGANGVRVSNNVTRNLIRGNSIHSNTSLGIDLGTAGVTPNDAGDPDTGANTLQNFPTLSEVVSIGGGSTTIAGALNSTASTTFTIEFFSSPTCDASGFGEGQVFLGSTSVTTDASGNATFNTTLASTTVGGQQVTATATDPNGNTSEFSSCSLVRDTVAWRVAASGNWSNAANWQDTQGVSRLPGTDDHVRIELAGTYAITLDVSASIASLTLGGASGVQTLAVPANTLTLGGASVVNANGVLNLSGGTITGAGPLTMGGAMNWTAGTVSLNTFNIPAGKTLSISGARAKALTGALNNTGTVTWAGTGDITFDSGTITNAAASLFNIQTDADLNDTNGAGTPAVFNNAGTLRKSAGAATTNFGTVAVNNTNLVESLAGTLGVTGAAYTQTAGTTLLNGGNLSTSIALQGGELRGIGTITGNLNNTGGTVRPGTSPGCLDIVGNYVQGASGTLDLEVAGNTVCTQFDRLGITGTATLDGTLNAALTGGFNPPAGTSFQVMTFASRTGTFSTVNGPFTLNFSATDLNVVRAGGAQTFTVTNTNDAGAGSLRQAILDANASTGTTDTIAFNITGAGVHTITPASVLPNITDPVSIDGYTQPGASANTLAVGDNAVRLITLNGANLPGGSIGLNITGGGSTVRGLTLNRFNTGIHLNGVGGNTVAGNFIGAPVLSLTNGTGVLVHSSGDIIGGTTPAARNIISGNIGGMTIAGVGTVVQGNYIGTNASGTAALGNVFTGINISGTLGASNNILIGGLTPAARNVISGNGEHGIEIRLGAAANNFVQGNFIGTDATGSVALGNGGAGVFIEGGNANTIGGNAAGAANLIANNVGAGVNVNDSFGEGGRNSVLANRIFSNGGLGIDLNDDDVTPHDGTGDPDTGPNDLQNFPFVTGAVTNGISTTVSTLFVSAPNSSFTLHFYRSGACDASGNGEGEQFLGSAVANTNNNGTDVPVVTFPVASPVGSVITATATDAAGNTSEFSPCRTVAAATSAIRGRVNDTSGQPMLGINIHIEGSASGDTTTDANGDYTFTNLPQGGNYTLTPSEMNFRFDPVSRQVNNLQADVAAIDFTGRLVNHTITGKIVDTQGGGIPGVTVTIAGALSAVTRTDAQGDFIFNNVPTTGSFVITPEKENHEFNPRNRLITNIGADARFESIGTLQAAPTPTPDQSDEFSGGPDPDFGLWAIGILTNPPPAFDPLVGVFLRGGLLHIQPRTNANGLSYSGLVSVRALDLDSTPIVSVEVVQAAQGQGTQTLFGLGTNSDNWFRFAVQDTSTLPTPTPNATPTPNQPVSDKSSKGSKAASGRSGNDATGQTLLFELNINGSKTSFGIPYDPAQHRFWRFRHDAPARLIVFETSPDAANWTERFRAQLLANQTQLIAELSAGSFRPSQNPIEALFDNFLVSPSPRMQFTNSASNAREDGGVAQVQVIRTGSDESPVAVDYATSDGTAHAGSDYAASSGNLLFGIGERIKTISVPLFNDDLKEGSERFNVTLSNPVGGRLGSIPLQVVTVLDDDAPSNPIDESEFFVRQHYLDFLGREPDAAGLAFWINNIESCGANEQCREFKRVDTSAAFFLSIEFQGTGYVVHRFYKASFGRPPTFDEYLPDLTVVREGIIVGEPGALERLETNKRLFAQQWVARTAFKQKYDGLNEMQYVDTLTANTGITLSEEQRTALIVGLLTKRETRAGVLLKIIENADFIKREFNPAFVEMEYFGYLRRTPDASGFRFWLDKLSAFGGDFRRSEMVKAFLTSIEYRSRFGQP